MRRNEQLIVVGLVVVGLLAAFWLLILSPKRNQASDLQHQVDDLHGSLTTAQQEVSASTHARTSFGIDYRRLVVLGKAVPADSEQASLLVQLQRLADRAGVRFESMDVSDSSASSATATPSTTTAPSTSSGSTSSPDSTSSGSSSTSAPAPTSASSGASASATSAVATEASAATLPIGASVGPAGLPVVPYDLTFSGEFFQVADFMKSVDGMVGMKHGLVDVSGRLLTVDGFSLTPVQSDSSNPTPTPTLTAELHVTSYLTPADQGLTAGATPGGPAPATPATATPASTSASTSTSTPTASTTSPSP